MREPSIELKWRVDVDFDTYDVEKLLQIFISEQTA